MVDASADSSKKILHSAPGLRPALLVGGLAALVITAWLLNTPEGVLGKADAIGYAICHRIDLRSFHLGTRQMPLCARCTGIYLGSVLGVAAVLGWGRARAGGFPSRGVLVTLLGFIAVMGFDGVNSYLTLFPGLPHLYEPQNWLRLTTGMFNGLALGLLVYPAFSQTLWREWDGRPALRGFRELGWLALAALGVMALVLGEDPRVLYPLALLSAAGVVMMLTLLNTTVLLMLTRRENRAGHWRDALLPLLAGLTVSMIEIGAVDALRFAIFRTWGGFPLPG
jgi:uncharacterized membrane protein